MAAGQGFWSLPGAWPYQSLRRRRRARRLFIEGEPEGKGPRGARAELSFRRQVAEQLRQRKQHTMTGPVALDLEFLSARKTPVAIHRMTKWALDVLGETQLAGKRQSSHRPCLYRDDRQVKLLHVTLRQGWPGQDGSGDEPVAGMRVFAQRLRDAVEDMRMLHELRARRELEDIAFDDSDDYPEVDVFREWDTDMPPVGNDPARNRINKFFARWGSFHNAEQAQKAALISIDRLMDHALVAGAQKIIPTSAIDSDSPRRELQELTERHASDHWAYALSFPFTIHLPPLPETSAGRVAFKEAIYSGLKQFHRRWPAWTTLLAPLRVTMIVVPPAQGKDLDNVALEVLPAVHEVFRPHIEPWLLAPTLADLDEDGEMAADRAAALKRLKSLNSESVTAYQVIELRRSPDDPPSGLLRLALGLGHGFDHAAQSLWRRNDSKLWTID